MPHIIERKIDFELGSLIARAGEDSVVYDAYDGHVAKFYEGLNPDFLLTYHRIHKSLSDKGVFEVDTESGELGIEVLNLGNIYHDPNQGYYSLPRKISGSRLIIRGTVAATEKAVLETLGVHKIGTNGLMTYNSALVGTSGNRKNVVITDLGGKIFDFVKHNSHLIIAEK